jgi:hypothetical protein
MHSRKWNETPLWRFEKNRRQDHLCGFCQRNMREIVMISEMQIHTIARQMLEKHGLAAIAEAAQHALASERRGDADEAREWRHVEDAMKMMRGPHQG